MEKTKLEGEVDQAKIDSWKKQHGEIFAVTGDNKVCYLKKPDRKILAYITSLGNNPIKMNEALINNCWLGGSENFKTDDALFLGLSQQIGTLVQIKQTEIAKL